jgi:NADH-quinone oxidoreductase subunit L
MAISSAIAIAGIALAAFIWLRRRRELAAAIATRFRGLYRLLLNKYYVDEVYDAAVVKPIRTASEHVLWQGVDVGVIDGAVNGTALVVATGSGMLRRLQTGSVRAYAGSMFIGVIVILGFYLWR